MAEELKITASSKEEKYLELLPQIRSVVEGETDMIANMANVASMLHETFGFWWTGFYRVSPPTPEGGLLLGPFQGSLACTRIKKGKGVCGTAWEREETVIVPDVDAFPGHIACSSLSRSEIVVPVWKDGFIVAVLDIDSKELATFDETDKRYLEEVVKML
ncbi:MAG: GAF domain-containing protein [Bacteroidaceae bacterium]|nr:GAF domain-containing protein [Bacteroidaceae bacterium]